MTTRQIAAEAGISAALLAGLELQKALAPDLSTAALARTLSALLGEK